ncbi:hypothetical protein WYO_0097 [Methylobacterium sp. GXF4]|jgi:hypothetical protein|uniref:hypothetical protein n=1 Tax=Methylobacterium sp. GXF4 TaxID=1096546 RepID=UPI0002698917|nr:hypothetical protein [Methylobacterium sp. GXF4]EIZ87233.1 hypothetical protein WYO_0097 [Methylobacterium sp. GXF4]
MADPADSVTEKIRACDRADAALQAALTEILKSRAEIAGLRESLVNLRAETVALPGLDPRPPEGGGAEAAQAPRLRSPVAQIIVEALAEAGDAGLSGMALNQIVARKGFQKDTSEKVKVVLKRANLVRHDRAATHWYAIGKGPKHIPGEGTQSAGVPAPNVTRKTRKKSP